MVAMKNKAHTATVNRICRRFGVEIGDEYDVQTDEMVIEVETSATLSEAIERLRGERRPAYVALTNKEGIKLAVTLADGTGVGVMDPYGEIMLPASASSDDEEPE